MDALPLIPRDRWRRVAGTIGRVLMLASLVAFAQLPPAAAQTGGAKALAEGVGVLAASAPAGTAPDGELAFRIALLLDRIAADHPRSLEAQLLRRQNRLPGVTVDAAAVRAAAAAWEAANPAAAAALRADPAADDPPAVASGDGGGAVVRLPPLPRGGAANPLVAPPATRSAPAALRPPAPAGGGGALRTASKDATRQALRRSAVMIYFVGQSARSANAIVPVHVGSGSFIGPDLVLTNAHVVDAMENNVGSWLVINETHGIWPAKVVVHARRDTPVKIDAAVLRIEGLRVSDWLGFNEAPRLDEWIAIAGYPGDATVFDARHVYLKSALEAGQVPDRASLPTALLNEGRVNNLIKDLQSGAVDVQYTMITGGGNSGSPVVNGCNEIVALHYSGGATNAAVKFNSGVHAREVATFLRVAGVPFASSAVPCATPD